MERITIQGRPAPFLEIGYSGQNQEPLTPIIKSGTILINPVASNTGGMVTVSTPNAPSNLISFESATGGIKPITPAGLIDIKTGVIAPIKTTIDQPGAGAFTIPLIETIVSDKIGVIPNANVSVNGTNYTPSDINGKIRLKNIASTANISISFIGYKTVTLSAMSVPAKITLEKLENENFDENEENKKNPNLLKYMGIALGVFVIGKFIIKK
jgi:hypothetical protein